MKIANWNIEWMNHWFTGDAEGPPRFRDADQIPGVTDIDGLARRVANVIRGLDADVVTVQEGPSRKSEMALFVTEYLGGDYDVLGPTGERQQRLYALVRKGGDVVRASRVYGTGAVDFAEAWDVDVTGNLQVDEYEFTREPLVVDVEVSGGRTVRLVNVHTKSKFVNRGRQMWRDPVRRGEFIEKAVLNRRRISAEVMRVREYLNELMADSLDAWIVVVGDFNDGPGIDFFERYYLTHNVVAIAAGSPFVPQRMFRHAFVDTMPKDDNYTAIFDDFVDEIPNRKVLLDHILVSPGLYWDQLTAARVEHAAYEAAIDQAAAGRQRLPSDHRPQTAEFAV